MRATVMFEAGDVRIENVPDPRIIEPTDAVVTVTRACICGSDLWPYNKMEHIDSGRIMGHEAIGVVDAVAADALRCNGHWPSRCGRRKRAAGEKGSCCWRRGRRSVRRHRRSTPRR